MFGSTKLVVLIKILIAQILSYKFNEELRQQETEKYKNQIKFYILLGVLIIAVTVGIILWRYNQQRKKAYERLEEQQNETEKQRAKAEAERALQMSNEMGYHWGKVDAEEVLGAISG
jgi:type VI protein secretion system component VasK